MNVLFSDMVFQDCQLSSNTATSIIELDACESYSSNEDSVQFVNVQFVGNTLSSGVAINAKNTTCTSMKLTEVMFVRNICSGACLAHMTLQNELRDVKIIQNSLSDSRNRSNSNVLLSAPPRSNTTIFRLLARKNDLAVIDIQKGRLELFNSGFFENKGPVVRLTQSSGSFQQMTCSMNVAKTEGGCLDLRNANAMINSSSITDNSAMNGGGIHSLDSQLSIIDTNVTNNRARESAGGIYVKNGKTKILRTAFVKNRSNSTGGALLCNHVSKLSIDDSNFRRNHAEKGGGMRAIYNCKSDIKNVSWSSNEATTYGGAISSELSTMNFQDSYFTRNTAAQGGAFDGFFGSVNFTHSHFEANEAHLHGGAIYLSKLEATFINCSLAENSATYGGCVAVQEVKTLLFSRANFTFCMSDVGGGAISMTESTGNIKFCHFEDNHSENGGSVIASQSNVFVKNSTFQRNRATRDGGSFNVIESRLELRRSYLIQNQANAGGCVLSASSKVQVNASQFVQCKATKTNGGAVLLDKSKMDIQNSKLTGNTAVDSGGAIQVTNSTLRADGVQISKNSADTGGGIATKLGSELNFANTKITSNNARYKGGGIATTTGSLKITSSTIQYNTAWSQGGAGIIERTFFVMKKSRLRRNCGQFGGSLYLIDSQTSINSTTFTMDRATNGGSIQAVHGSVLQFENSHIIKSKSKVGGGIYVADAKLNVSNSHFLECIASDKGGGVFATSLSTVLFWSSTFKSNEAFYGGAFNARLNTPRRHAIQFDQCTFDNNIANLGGRIPYFGPMKICF